MQTVPAGQISTPRGRGGLPRKSRGCVRTAEWVAGCHKMLTRQLSAAGGSGAVDACPEAEYQPDEGEAACKRCDIGQSSIVGSSECTVYAEQHYRPFSNSTAAECSRCAAVVGVECRWNSTMATLNLTERYWRLSSATLQTWPCKRNGDWSPCTGGADVGHEGDGYCAKGYRGPRCELCAGPAYSRHSDKLSASCQDCGDVTAQSALLACGLIVLLLAIFAFTTASNRLKDSARCGAMIQWTRSIHAVWHTAGMRYKVKALVGFYQCASAVPSVYNVVPPLDLEEYTRWWVDQPPRGTVRAREHLHPEHVFRGLSRACAAGFYVAHHSRADFRPWLRLLGAASALPT